MKMTSFVAAATVSFLLAGGSAMAATLDFDTQNGNTGIGAGNITGNEFTDFGVTISSAKQLALFNSNCGADFDNSCKTTGTDKDLATGPQFGTAPQGNVLILNGGTNAKPNDDASGGTFRFDFEQAVTFDAVSLLDLDEKKAEDKVTFTFSFADLTVQTFTGLSGTLLNPSFPGDNSLRTFAFGLEDVTRLDIGFKNVSGAVASLDYAPVPLPAGLVLILTGMGALGLASRTRGRTA